MNAPSPHPTPDELTRYAARRLPAAEVLRLSDHLAQCTDCRSELAQLRPSTHRQSGAFLSEPAGVVPDFDDLAGELDGTLTPSQHEELAAELARSPAARDALADLAAFRNELAALPVTQHRPQPSPADQSATGHADQRVIPLRWRWQPAAAWATGLAALFMAMAVGSWMFTRHGERSLDLLRNGSGQAAELARLPAALRESVEQAARTGQLPPTGPAPATHREILAGTVAGVQFSAVSPVGIVVRERRPILRWTPRQEATGYQVSYADTDGGPLLTSPLLPAGQTQWVPSEVLQRGTTYQWQVEALRGETVIDRAPKPPAGEAQFRVLDTVSDDELERAEKYDSDYPLVLGVAYRRAGLAAAAAEQFHRLARTHGQSVVAQRLERAATTDVPAFLPANPEAAP